MTDAQRADIALKGIEGKRLLIWHELAMSKPGRISNNLISAFTEEQAARLTGISKRQLGYWDKTEFFKPSIYSSEAGDRFGRIYSFRDLVSLKILNYLRNEQNVPLGNLRELKEKWSHMGDDVWRCRTLYVANGRVVIDSDSGFQDAISGQGVLEIPLRAECDAMQRNVSKLFARQKNKVGRIEKNRYVSHNKPVIAGTRVPVSSIKAYASEGYSVDDILAEYPSLKAKDIKAAIKY